ncbi:hypothetical protein V498_07195 [Pseudogymnoascus sp. VKM F-4517 (FW-2822)]|nr:hypothetical protein V498_07195 [Pseudogymnoascus sp. VKM F-4517 (FW-2822)]
MSQLSFQNHCSACEATSAQWARVNARTDSRQDVSTPGKPFPIPPTFGTDSHPYARQIGYTEIMIVPEPEIPQNKVRIQPEYNVVVKKNFDMDYVKELIANIFPPGSLSEDAVPMPSRPNVPTPPGMSLRHDLSGLALGDALPSPKPYVPTPPYEQISASEMDDAFPPPRPYVPPRPPPRTYGLEMEDAFSPPRPYVPPRPPPRTYGLEMEDAFSPPRPYVPPRPPPRTYSSGLEKEGAIIPPPRPNVPLPPDAPPIQGLSGSNPEDVLPTPRPNVPLPPDAPPNQSLFVSNTEDALSFVTI